MYSSFFKSARQVSSHLRRGVVDFSNSPLPHSSDSTAEKCMIAGLQIGATLVVGATVVTGIDAHITLNKIRLQRELEQSARDKINSEGSTLKEPRL